MSSREAQIADVRSQVEDLAPRNEIMQVLWVGALQFSISHKPTMQAFSEETGLHYTAPRNGLDRMIDEATGADSAFLLAFIRWFNVNVWGEENGKPVDAPCPPSGQAETTP